MSQVCEAFPSLTLDEIEVLRPMATAQSFADGEQVFKVGQADVDMFVVESGQIDILNPSNNELIISHSPGQFSGDIDLLTQRPIIVTGVARGATNVLRVPGKKLRELLNRLPRISETMMTAFTQRRKLVEGMKTSIGLSVVGPAGCRDTNLVREFLFKNFVPFKWTDSDTPDGRRLLVKLGSPRRLPAVECGDGKVLARPTLHDLACCAGVWQGCPDTAVDLAIIGGGPAGISAAVYAASEGLSTLVLEQLGPGGQAGGSSRVENFIGFPAGITGAEFATRGVLQMLKFGARIVAPVTVERLEPAYSPDGLHTLHLNCGNKIQARTVLLATGVHWRKLDAPGAAKFENAGIFYLCTKMEAVLYDKCDVAVVGGGNSAGQAAMFMAEFCRDRTVHVLVRRRLEDKMSEYLTSRIRANKNIVVHEETEISAVHGERRLESVQLTSKNGLSPQSLACNAIFVFTGAEPPVAWLPEGIARDKLGYLLTGADAARDPRWPLTDRDPCPLETTMPGILAAGDVRSGSTKRVGFAVGDGSMAVTCAHHLRSLQTHAEAPALVGAR